MDITRLRGIGVSPGIAMGEVLLPKRVVFTSRKELITEAQVPDEIKRLRQALDRTRDDLVRVKDGVKDKLGRDSSFIFVANLLILDDPTLVGGLMTDNQKKLTLKKLKKMKDPLYPLIPCPGSKSPMMRTFYSLAYLIEIDRCTYCNLTWFHRDELEMLQCVIENKTTTLLDMEYSPGQEREP